MRNRYNNNLNNAGYPMYYSTPAMYRQQIPQQPIQQPIQQPMPQKPMQQPMQQMPIQQMPVPQKPMQPKPMPQPMQPMPPYMESPMESPMETPMENPNSYMPEEDNYMNMNDMNMNDMDMSSVSPEMMAQGDPPPILSNNPVTVNLVLHKELTAYPNYGNPSRNADILYTGNRGTWTFQTPAFLFVPGNERAQLLVRAVLDDHTSVPVNRYSARITVNGTVVHNGRLQLEHGQPAGGMFNNWREIPLNIPTMRRTTSVTIENTSNAGNDDWIAFDWMEVRLRTR
jgi:hypothetical protein